MLLDLNPEIALFTETHLQTNAALKIDNYTFFGQARNDTYAQQKVHRAAGGVGILVRNDLKHCITPHTSNRAIEITWISVQRKDLNPFYVGVYYGKQESRVSKEEIEEEMDILTEEIMQMKNEGEVLLVMDGNGHIGIMGEKISRNGKLLLNVFECCEMEILNLSEKCVGKKTRIAKNKNEHDSAIDFVTASCGFSQCIKEVKIDEDGLHRLKGKSESDHNSIIIKISLKNIQTIPKRKIVTWKMSAPEEVWHDYEKKLAEYAYYTEILMNDNTISFQQRYNIWENGLNKIIENTIGKTTINAKKKDKFSSSVIEIRSEKRKLKKLYLSELNPQIKSEIKDKYIQKQKQLQMLIQKEREGFLQERFEKMIDSGPNGFWRERRQIQKDDTVEWMITKNEQGERLYDPEENMNNIANYYENLYKRQRGKTNPYHGQVRAEMVEFKHDHSFESESYNSEPTLEMIQKAIDNKKNKKATTDFKNEFLKRGGSGIAKAIHCIIKTVWKEEAVPLQWNESIITSVWKNKGDREMMKNQRGISVSSSIAMILEEIVNDRILDVVKFSPAQGGGVKNYSTCDHVFLLRSIITYSIKMHRQMIITFYDVAKAYDHAEREDMMHVMWKKGLKGKLWRIMCALNENLTSRIKTPHGMTRQIQREVGGKQGGKIMCSTFAKTMDTLAEDMYENDEVGITIKETKISALLFVDDVITMADSYSKQQKTLDVVNVFAHRHSYTWGVDKCAVLEIGKHSVSRLKWKLGDSEINHENHYKYLGDIISRDGTNSKNIEERFTKIKKSTYSIITCGKDELMKNIQIWTVLKLHETVNIPTLLHNSESWLLTKTDRLNLEKIEMWALKRMLNLPRTTPSVAIRYVTGTSYMKTRIDIRQMLYLWKVLTKPEDSWPKKIFFILDEYKIGWSGQIRQILEEYGLHITWEQIETLTKSQWRNQVHIAAEKHNREMMISECHQQKEPNNLKTKTVTIIEKLNDQDYHRRPLSGIVGLNKLYAKAIIMGRYGMLDCACNYRSKYKTVECLQCKKEDNENHRMNECAKWRRDDSTNMSFSQIYSDESETLKTMAKQILSYWCIEHGKNQMGT